MDSIEKEKLAEFPFTVPSIRNLKTLDFHPKVTFFTGENGSGKSTLLEAIAVYMGLSAEGGSKNHVVSTFDSHSGLHDHIRIGRTVAPAESFFLRAETLYNVSTYLNVKAKEVNDPSMYGDVHLRSHGEEFFAIFYNFEGNGLYLFDEPEAALSIQRQFECLAWIHQMVTKKKSQLIIATHSPILLSYPHSKIVEFTTSGMKERNYEETDQYVLMKSFISDPQRYLSRLLNLKEIE
jgi:predicted ATPase